MNFTFYPVKFIVSSFMIGMALFGFVKYGATGFNYQKSITNGIKTYISDSDVNVPHANILNTLLSANTIYSTTTGSASIAEASTLNPSVLAAETTAPTFNINVVSNFNDVAHFWKGLTGLSVDTGTLTATGSATFAGTTTNGNATFLANTDIKGDLTSPSTIFNLLNKGVTALNIGGAASTISIGATSGTTTINDALTAAGKITGSSDLAITGATTLSGKATLGSDLTVAGATTLTGNLTAGGGTNAIAGTLNLSGNTLTSSGNLTITPGGGSVILSGSDVINVGGSGTTAAYNLFATTSPSLVNGAITSAKDVYFKGSLQVAGTIYGNIVGTSINTGFTSGSVTFTDASGNLAQNNSQFFWDQTNNRLGIGTNASGSTLTVNGTTNLAGSVTLGTTSADTITLNGSLAPGTSIIPQTNLTVDLGSPSFRFNNLYVGSINSNASSSTAGQALITYSPLDTTYAQSSVEINPASAPANSYLLGIGIAGSQVAGLDAEGDATFGYSGTVNVPNNAFPISAYGHTTTKQFSVDTFGRIDSDLSSTNFIAGGSAGNTTLTSTDTTAIGNSAGHALTNGADNTLYGYLAGEGITTGAQNTILGSQAGITQSTVNGNVFIGYQAGNLDTAATSTFIGSGAGTNNSSGVQNTFLGYQAGNANTSSNSDTFVGYKAGTAATGADNTFVGNSAGLLITTGSQNVLVGSQAGGATSTDVSQVTFIGYQAGNANTSSNSDTFVGYQAGLINTSGSSSTYVGYQA